MTRAAQPADQGLDPTPGVAQLAREIDLVQLLETGAHRARRWYGAAYLIVDRTGNPATADIKGVIDGSRLVDLWDLDPMLWDDVHWAAIRSIEPGEIRTIQPALHRD